MIDIAQIYEQTDAEFEAQKQPMFEGEGGFGTFEGDGGFGTFEGDGGFGTLEGEGGFGEFDASEDADPFFSEPQSAEPLPNELVLYYALD